MLGAVEAQSMVRGVRCFQAAALETWTTRGDVAGVVVLGRVAVCWSSGSRSAVRAACPK